MGSIDLCKQRMEELVVLLSIYGDALTEVGCWICDGVHVETVHTILLLWTGCSSSPGGALA